METRQWLAVPVCSSIQRPRPADPPQLRPRIAVHACNTRHDAVPAVVGDGLEAGPLTPVAGMLFRYSPATYNNAWHNAPRRQLIVNLSNGVEIVLTDGRRRRSGPGSIICAEDLTGKGHISRHAGTGEGLTRTLPIAE